jgi:hypothetical protein
MTHAGKLAPEPQLKLAGIFSQVVQQPANLSHSFTTEGGRIASGQLAHT